MSGLLVRPDGEALVLTPERAGWRYVGFETVALAAGGSLTRRTGDRELCAVVLAGRCEVRVDGRSLGGAIGRRDPFDGAPPAIYAPPGCLLEIHARDALALAIGSAPARGGAAPRILDASGARLDVRGSGLTERRIHNILMEDREAESLLVTEVITPPGHWSSFPPHKHDLDDFPRETYLEETYYFRFSDPRGFALQRVYTADRSLDESIAPRDGDLVLVPRGYHTVSAAPGYQTYYLNVMAGPRRAWCVCFDPDQEWQRT